MLMLGLIVIGFLFGMLFREYEEKKQAILDKGEKLTFIQKFCGFFIGFMMIFSTIIWMTLCIFH